MKKYISMWDGHLDRDIVAEHRTVLNPTDAPPIHSAPYFTGPKQRELEGRDMKKIREASVAEPVLTE